MTEIERLYKNAGIEPQYKKRTECKDGYTVGHPCEKGIACINCNRSVFEDVMPPFTAEKQLLLIQWLAKTRPIHINFLLDKWVIEGMVRYGIKYDTFEDALSGYINQIWKDLTDQEKKEIRRILNE